MKTIPGKPGRLDDKSKVMQNLFKVICKIPFIPSIGCYNITISHEKKFIWFRVAKVGTRTILNHLRECGVYLDVEHANFIHYPIKSYHNYFKFAFVRNPWDRIVSCWQNKVIIRNQMGFTDSALERMKKFENFVNFVSALNIEQCDRHLRSQSTLIDLNNIDYLGRMETFEEDANYVFQRLGLIEKEVVPKNVTLNRKPYQEYYNKVTIEKVSQIYRKDIQIFGYRF